VLGEQAGDVLGSGGGVDPAHVAIAARAVLEIGLNTRRRSQAQGFLGLGVSSSRASAGSFSVSVSVSVLDLRIDGGVEWQP